jgi:hypothetical protein
LFGTTQSHNAFAAALGGGFDFRLNRHFSLRPLEVDYLPTRFQKQASAGRRKTTCAPPLASFSTSEQFRKGGQLPITTSNVLVQPEGPARQGWPFMVFIYRACR